MTISRAGKTTSAVLTIRIDANLTRSLTREALRRRKTKSELAREILAAGLSGEGGNLDLAQEARRQSILVSRRRSERDSRVRRTGRRYSGLEVKRGAIVCRRCSASLAGTRVRESQIDSISVQRSLRGEVFDSAREPCVVDLAHGCGYVLAFISHLPSSSCQIPLKNPPQSPLNVSKLTGGRRTLVRCPSGGAFELGEIPHS